MNRRWGPPMAALLWLATGAATVGAQDPAMARPAGGIACGVSDGGSGRAWSGLRLVNVHRFPPSRPAGVGAWGCRTLLLHECVTVRSSSGWSIAHGGRHDQCGGPGGAPPFVADLHGVQYPEGTRFSGPRVRPAAYGAPRYAAGPAPRASVHGIAWGYGDERFRGQILVPREPRIRTGGGVVLPSLVRSLLAWRTTRDIARVAARLVTAGTRVVPRGPDLKVGVAAGLPARGSPASWHRHLSLVVR